MLVMFCLCHNIGGVQVNQEVRGALDKYNFYLFISNSTEDFKLNPIPKFSADSVNAFSF